MKLSKVFISFFVFSELTYAHEVDLNKEELVRLSSDFLVKDLSIGDSMRVSSWSFCVEDNRFRISSLVGNTKKSEYSSEFKILMRPDNKISLTITPRDEDERIEDLIPGWSECYEEDAIFYMNKPKPVYYYVTDINGFSKLSSYINYLYDEGFKKGSRY
ncbi:MAG: hypothetical protein CMD75_05850 [Gammaproteobacteria bacterium]|nr:hypothetical protein [Gammaproteobacteria bacterium]|tara:strand:- start:233 stop:709 length:477 start_codon:yes stop_codon:yes gene_type:complete